MAIVFPSNPTLNQVYTVGGLSWTWDGTAWTLSASGIQGIQGIQGNLGNQGTQGTTGTQGLQGTKGTYTVSASAPSNPVAGDTWLNTTDGRLYSYSGTEWFEPYNNQQGVQGTQGLQGTSGSNGTQGTTGIQGSGGTNGTQGVQGTTGTASVGKIIAMAIVFGG